VLTCVFAELGRASGAELSGHCSSCLRTLGGTRNRSSYAAPATRRHRAGDLTVGAASLRLGDWQDARRLHVSG
jgi:hypothetical protein